MRPAAFGYLGGVTAVVLAGVWVALAAWTLRSGPVHVLSLVLLFWGMILGAAQVLPRVGYAAEKASWQCSATLTLPGWGPSWP